VIKVYSDKSLDMPHVSHGFFSRGGGVSEGIYESLNCGPGSGDELSNIMENRNRVCNALDAEYLVTAHQIHSPDVCVVKEPWEIGHAPKCDALVTSVPGLAIGILTADCAPVLLTCEDKPIIAAVHAGWGGALAGVVQNTIFAMEDMGAEKSKIRAVIGPCIGPESYEVRHDFYQKFLAQNPSNECFFSVSGDGHWLFNLGDYVRWVGLKGIEKVEQLGRDTYVLEDEFFSYRRSCHNGEKDYGRQISAIALVKQG